MTLQQKSTSRLILFLYRCGWFTYFPEQGLCQLLSKCRNISRSSCPSCLGGPFGCKVPQGCIKGQCQGEMLASEAVANLEECQTLCRSTKGCKWFTFNNETDPFCLLLQNCFCKDKTCSSCVSGEPHCSMTTGEYWLYYQSNWKIIVGVLSSHNTK